MKNTLPKDRYTLTKLTVQKYLLKRNHYKNGALSLLPEGNEFGCSFHIQEGGKTIKKLIIATTVTACIALCAAVWAQSEVIEETLAPTPTAAVCAAEEGCVEPEPKEELMSTEDEITAVAQAEEVQESPLVSEPEPESIEIPTSFETLPGQEQTSAPAPMQESAPTQTTKAL